MVRIGISIYFYCFVNFDKWYSIAVVDYSPGYSTYIALMKLTYEDSDNITQQLGTRLFLI